MSIKLVAIDLDNTLLRNDKSYDKERFTQVVETLVEQGVTLVIASGNDVGKIKSYMPKEILDRIYLAGDNGNDIEFNGEHIHTNHFSLEALHEIANIVDADDELQMVVNTQHHTYSKYIYEKDKEHVGVYYDHIHILDSYDDLPKGELPVKCAILSSKSLEETKEVLRQIEEEIKGLTSVTSGDGWLDAYSEDGGKGSAVSWLQEKYNIFVDETIAFGDSLNDSSMMEFAKYSVTMKNADDEFKEYCHYEIGSNEDQAVINILEKFVETGNAEFMENYKL